MFILVRLLHCALPSRIRGLSVMVIMVTKTKYRYFIIIQECQSEFYAIKYITPERTARGSGNSISD